MRKTLIAALLLLSSPAFAEQAGCYLENAKGDRFTFTADDHRWRYKSATGEHETCFYGADPDAGWFTVTCSAHGIDLMVKAHDGYAEIGDVRFNRICPTDKSAVDLGL